MKQQSVILVNEKDEPLGVMEKMEAHRQGLLHRAFSVFIFDRRGRMLLQQRAGEKYHGAYLWTNACCSHPNPDEKTEDAAQRRLKEELGFSTPLQKIFTFTYREPVENNLVEHEYDHVFAGEWESKLQPDPSEVADLRYEDMEALKKGIRQEPDKYTAWFRIAFSRIEEWWKTQYGS